MISMSNEQPLGPGHRRPTCTHWMTYGMRCEEYDRLRERAAGRCEICDLPEEQNRYGHLCIDHDPRYGRMAVRGLLCGRCNAILGHIDAGTRPHTRRTYRYYDNAWFIQRLADPKADYTLAALGIDNPLWGAWQRLGKAVGQDRNRLVAAFISWYLGDGKGVLPERPCDRRDQAS